MKLIKYYPITIHLCPKHPTGLQITQLTACPSQSGPMKAERRNENDKGTWTEEGTDQEKKQETGV
jgi:hypothetical protein